MTKLISITVNNRKFETINQANEFISRMSRFFIEETVWPVELLWDSCTVDDEQDSFTFKMHLYNSDDPKSKIFNDIALNVRAELKSIAEDPTRTLGLEPKRRNLIIKTCARFLKDYELPDYISA